MTSLIDRYVFTALRRVPEQQRADIDRELRASIADAVDARVDTGADHDTAVEQTLLELGDPDALADRYAGRRSYLLGPELFGTWRRVMKMLFTLVLPIVVVALAVAEAVGGGNVGEVIGSAIGTLITVGVHMAFWTTAVFVLLERTGQGREELGLVWKPDDLPRYAEGRRVGSQLVVDLVWITLLIAALVLQQFTFTAEPLLDPAGWTFWWPYLIVVMVLEGAYVIWTSRLPVRTHLVTVVNAVLALAAGIPLVWLAATDRFFNPDGLLGDPDVHPWATGSMIVLTVVATVWDIVDQARRTQRSRKGEPVEIPGTGLAI
ncbi:permease prefix domain 1-containing protein [Symbioplanes lichenis]|uniref:permease prefix domain 1-containing protein n=1 Tax=Symbioplanes lichenis TaxID=1629072 RepID=UPI002739EF70|nr:permease prefix domain 1-containing protein [Actinoplanes lichenis]